MGNKVDEIEGILDDFNGGLAEGIVDDNTLVFEGNDEEALRQAREEREKAIRERTESAKRAADEIVSSAKELYTKNTNSIDYVQFKAKADADSLGKILYQVEVTEDVIGEVVEAIKTGFVNPNMVKCFTDLQKTEIELLKTKNLYLTSIEESFKQITTDVEMNSAIEVDAEDSGDALTAKTRSSRDLMKMVDAAAAKMKADILSNNNCGTDDAPQSPKLF